MNASTANFGDERLGVALAPLEEGLGCTLTDRATGIARDPVPLVTLEIHNSADQRTTPHEAYAVEHLDLLDGGAGAHVTLLHRRAALRVGLWLRVRNGALEIRMPLAETDEMDGEGFRLFAARFLPGLMTVEGDDRVLLPFGTGVTFRPADKPLTEDRFLIYGEQPRWELLPNLPVVACHGKSRGGWIALATGCAEDGLIRTWTDGRGQGGADAGTCLREHWPDPVDPATREVRFLPLRPEEDLVHATADAVRRLVTEEMGKPTLAERAEASPEVRYLLEAYTMKLFYGIQHHGHGERGLSEGDAYRPVMNFKEAADGLRRIHRAGLEKVHTVSVGWIERGHDGCYPSHDRVDARPGGEAGFRELIAEGHRLGYRMNVHDNYNEAYESSPDLDWNHIARDLYGQPTKRGRWGGGQGYLQWMLALPPARVEEALARVKAFGLSGMAYVDAIGNPLYRNYHPLHRGPRGDHARGIERVVQAAKAVHGAIGIECGFLYAARHVDSVCAPRTHRAARGLQPHWPVNHLMEKRVPLYILALSGLLTFETPNRPNASNLLEAMLLNNHPHDEWGYHAGYGGAPLLDDARIERQKAFYEIRTRRFGHLLSQRITRWEELGGDRERTVYEDGTEVEADFANKTLRVGGEAVEIPACLLADEKTPA